ncbi:parallel beta-helix repeat protein [Clostridium acetobutylicum]|uniref:Pectate lyase related enzyme n=1 Tax=Clostridium acetobutylicum (strain ATCC 824 / DSM 792 / JCM 1419 / IAM 19013 / LMG 5710 / NBRC 13948 / NRRL B-527 / VKM B-1787 / 2291 / W) TaxID=272562 RepID=Q97HP2_CLOAB|nr:MULTISPECIES: right-handed parallel beta-helix repeat-containing protein [Clostridium]AAK79928.1 Pectate lyase related enzyme [Clostridium acetobutylicum ATCC 824]ADZ21021.1 Pectate lyase related enzyme [Clostridium acetobutylicum EA 2018]AEI32099.1 Pectate lyase related enzyme [Clostridium acetobutylicum DSM 1731]AWV79640.1 right-handed parallel beta-helix repeat-containing protein [Clostridium acetobutylicum]MBC2394387.1 right-handed parallel beta-helix repeat-containing protein [Clostrid
MNKKILSLLTSVAIISSVASFGVQAKSVNAKGDIASKLEAGGVIPAGNYTLNRGVKVTKPISAEGVVIDASACPKGTIAIVARANISGITINNAKRQGISVQNCSGITIKNCKVTKAQFAGIEAKDNVSNVTFENCESDYNFDNANGGEDADGFGIKNGAKNITLKNCVAIGNSDDGYDTYTAGSNITFLGCRAQNNGSGKNGDGNGFKLGPCLYKNQDGGLVTVKNCTALNNKGVGFLRNHNKVAPVQSGNIASGNKGGDFKWDYTPRK